MTPVFERFRVVIVGAAPWGADDALPAIAAANCDVIAALGGDAVDLPAADLLVLHAEDAAVADALPRLLDAATCPVVVTLAEAQIDAVAPVALAADAQPLCAPSPLDWALAIALARGDARAAGVREGGSDRIARINTEIARIAGQLVALSREGPGAAVGETGPGFDPGPDGPDPVTATEIRALIRARRLRDKQFGEGLFEDPAWDMMLDLYAAQLEGIEVSVSSLCIAAAVAPTTALRWITRLTVIGLFARTPDPFDRRRALMALSDRGRAGMRAHFAALRAQGLPLA